MTPAHWLLAQPWSTRLTIEITKLGLTALVVLVAAVIVLAYITGYQHGHRRGLDDASEPREPPYRRY